MLAPTRTAADAGLQVDYSGTSKIRIFRPTGTAACAGLQVDYSGLNVDQVWDCTGVFLTRKALQPYFDKGVPKVVVSAPVKDAAQPVLNIVYGVNHVSVGLVCCARRHIDCV